MRKSKLVCVNPECGLKTTSSTTYSVLLCLGFKDVPIFYDPPVWGLQNVDPPPLLAWDTSN